MDFESAVKYLDSFVSYEKMKEIPYGEGNFDLKNFRNFLKAFGVDYGKLRFVHVAGSKGKGAVSRIVGQYLSALGYKTGVYTSPHLFEVKERISLNGKNISKDDFSVLMEDLKKFLKKKVFRLTYFEVLTAIALKFFVEKKVDFVVLEVGLGGRLDATNVVVPEISVITAIEEEHKGILGNNLSEIMDEKLGIIKEGIPVIVGEQSKESKKLMEEKIGRREKIFWANPDLIEVSHFHCRYKDEGYQKNCRVSYLVLEKLLGRVEKKLFQKVVENFFIPGHFDRRQMQGHEVVFDVAHTKESILNLVRGLEKIFPEMDFVFLISLMKGKDVSAIFEQISKKTKKIILTSSNPERGYLGKELESFLSCFDGEIIVEENCRKAFDVSLGDLKKNQVLVVTGSHFLVSKLLPSL